MLFLRLWNYLRGYVNIIAEGYFLEKFINLCIAKGIFLWDIKREKSSIMLFKTGISSFKRLRGVARKTRCRIEVKAKKGLPFILNRYRRRKAFAAGAFGFILMVYLLSSFLWTVEVVGNKTVPAQDIIQNLEKLGLKAGVFKFGIDTGRMVNEILIKRSDLSWIGIRITGTKAVVEVKERTLIPEMLDRDIPCNILAAKDGVIKRMVVRTGTPVVSEGDTVKRGQLLVAGILEDQHGVGIGFIHALADIKARTWYIGESEVPLVQTISRRTDKVHKSYSLRIFLREIKLGSQKIPFEDYDLVTDKKRLSLGKNCELPFELVINTYYEKKPGRLELGTTQAEEMARKEALGKAMAGIPKEAQIVDNKFNVIHTADAVKAKITIECSEEIGLHERILRG